MFEGVSEEFTASRPHREQLAIKLRQQGVSTKAIATLLQVNVARLKQIEGKLLQRWHFWKRSRAQSQEEIDALDSVPYRKRGLDANVT